MKANDAAKLQDAQSGGTTESIRRTHATAKPGSNRTRATTGEAGPARGPGSAAVPRGSYPRAVPSPPVMVLISIEKEDTSLEP